jgi:hypothetical protein
LDITDTRYWVVQGWTSIFPKKSWRHKNTKNLFVVDGRNTAQLSDICALEAVDKISGPVAMSREHNCGNKFLMKGNETR